MVLPFSQVTPTTNLNLFLPLSLLKSSHQILTILFPGLSFSTCFSFSLWHLDFYNILRNLPVNWPLLPETTHKGSWTLKSAVAPYCLSHKPQLRHSSQSSTLLYLVLLYLSSFTSSYLTTLLFPYLVINASYIGLFTILKTHPDFLIWFSLIGFFYPFRISHALKHLPFETLTSKAITSYVKPVTHSCKSYFSSKLPKPFGLCLLRC